MSPARGILWAVVLDPGSLLAAVPPRFAAVHAHHVTLRFDTDLAPYAPRLGETHAARVTAEAWDDEVQAVRVALPPELARLADQPHPHVTISLAPGVPPKLAGALLEAPRNERPLDLPLGLRLAEQRWGRKGSR